MQPPHTFRLTFTALLVGVISLVAAALNQPSLAHASQLPPCGAAMHASATSPSFSGAQTSGSFKGAGATWNGYAFVLNNATVLTVGASLEIDNTFNGSIQCAPATQLGVTITPSTRGPLGVGQSVTFSAVGKYCRTSTWAPCSASTTTVSTAIGPFSVQAAAATPTPTPTPTHTVNPGAPGVAISANGQWPTLSVAYGSPVTVHWTSQNIKNCYGFNTPSPNAGNLGAVDGNYHIASATYSSDWYVYCDGPWGSAQNKVHIEVGAPPPPPAPAPSNPYLQAYNSLDGSATGCTIAYGPYTTCKTLIKWGFSNWWGDGRHHVASVQVKGGSFGTQGKLFDDSNTGFSTSTFGGSWIKTADFVDTQTYTFELYLDGALQKTLQISGKKMTSPPAGTITANPTTCTLSASQKTCPITLSWALTHTLDAFIVLDPWPPGGAIMLLKPDGTSAGVYTAAIQNQSSTSGRINIAADTTVSLYELTPDADLSAHKYGTLLASTHISVSGAAPSVTPTPSPTPTTTPTLFSPLGSYISPKITPPPGHRLARFTITSETPTPNGTVSYHYSTDKVTWNAFPTTATAARDQPLNVIGARTRVFNLDSLPVVANGGSLYIRIDFTGNSSTTPKVSGLRFTTEALPNQSGQTTQTTDPSGISTPDVPDGAAVATTVSTTATPSATAVATTPSATATVPAVFSNNLEDYDYSYVGQTRPSGLKQGQSAQYELTILNTGTTAWSSDIIHLATDRPQDRTPQFIRDDIVTHNPSGWLSPNRIKMVQPVVNPGEVATFRFWYSIPQTLPDGTYREYFRPVADGIGFMQDLGIYWDVVVGSGTTTSTSPTDFQAAWVSQTSNPSLKIGDAHEFEVKLQNVGTATWTQDVVKLGTDRPQDHTPFYDREDAVSHNPSGWLSTNRISMVESSVKPGEIATFRFWYTVPSKARPGTYREYFRPVAENITWMNDLGIYWDVTIVPKP